MPSLNVQCPNCGKQYLKIKSNLIGHRVQCECGTVFRLGDAADKIDRKPLRQQKDRKNSPVAAHPEPPPTNRLPVAVPKMSSTLFEEDLPGLTDPVPEPPPISLERPPIATEEPYVVAALADDEFPVLVESEPIANTTSEQFVLADPVFADGEYFSLRGAIFFFTFPSITLKITKKMTSVIAMVIRADIHCPEKNAKIRIGIQTNR